MYKINHFWNRNQEFMFRMNASQIKMIFLLIYNIILKIITTENIGYHIPKSYSCTVTNTNL